MLDLDDTALLLDALRPPRGYELDVAVGTTFTLDLVTLLAVPVSATMTAEQHQPADVLETIRRYADRTIMFCQAGAIGIPSSYRPALTFIEGSVVEIKKPGGGIFHPKVWVVRFSKGDDTTHRVIVLSRNLTFDRALDVMARFDEDGADGPRLDTSELEGLLGGLPRASARKMPAPQRAMLRGLLESLKVARLSLPSPFTSGRTVALKPGPQSVFFAKSCDRALAISPFLTAPATSEFLTTGKSWAGVVSRRSSLDSAASGLRAADKTFRLRDVVVDVQDSLDELVDVTEDVTARPAHRGLHAKAFIQDHARFSTVWMGSANLTDAAMTTNYELMVELTGPRAEVGVDRLLNLKAPKNNLASFVEAYAPDPSSAGSEEVEISDAEHLAYALASSEVHLVLTDLGETFDVELTAVLDVLPEDATVTAHILSLPNDVQAVVRGSAKWGGLTTRHITPFVVLRVELAAKSHSVLVRATMTGDPEGRKESTIALAIRTRDDFLRYLGALLGWNLPFLAGGDGDGERSGGRWGSAKPEDRLLEDLVTTASRAPERFESLESTLRHLESNPELAGLTPPEFRQLWDAVRSARKGRR
ncbi:phospholipase D family protein [Aeromicrobium wangtongii]|uniref:Phospholipase D family protein n=1 Tax=Aeromicrobium wangtongii TaxID=2969247 RepID=A0ABY5M5W8_9ACTN|nr:phospholipase D family protein [Aeromicrobium wangtongii]MCD9198327.1 phospholipase D family protein [Aeromicrobium wangtongii]UUP12359.1 phospholipase D family protein [Aeromicrobium wangtongii]